MLVVTALLSLIGSTVSCNLKQWCKSRPANKSCFSHCTYLNTRINETFRWSCKNRNSKIIARLHHNDSWAATNALAQVRKSGDVFLQTIQAHQWLSRDAHWTAERAWWCVIGQIDNGFWSSKYN